MSLDDDERAERLRLARQEAGFEDAASAARAFGWPVVSYRSHENGIRGLRPMVAKRYARAYKVSAAWLMSGEGTMRGPGIDAQLMELPKSVSDELIASFNRIIATTKGGRKLGFQPVDNPDEALDMPRGGAATGGNRAKSASSSKRRSGSSNDA